MKRDNSKDGQTTGVLKEIQIRLSILLTMLKIVRILTQL